MKAKEIIIFMTLTLDVVDAVMETRQRNGLSEVKRERERGEGIATCKYKCQSTIGS